MLIPATAATLLGLSAYSWFVEPQRYRIRHHALSIKGSLSTPLRILQISDFHFYRGQLGRKRFLARLAQIEVDLIFITGDLIDNNSGIDLCLESLKPLKAKYGIYCVLGNHDYVHVSFRHLFHRTGTPVEQLGYTYNDTERLVSGLMEMGIHVLRNERRNVFIEGGEITIAGIDDPYLKRDDIPAVFKDFDKQHPCFVLIHAPDRYQQLMEVGADMVFSGHTHGGQVCIPFWGPLITRSRAPRQYSSGLTRVNGTIFHTTRGIGSSRLTRPRFFCPPEVNLFEISFIPNQATLSIS